MFIQTDKNKKQYRMRVPPHPAYSYLLLTERTLSVQCHRTSVLLDFAYLSQIAYPVVP